jgi:hypothetical protein
VHYVCGDERENKMCGKKNVERLGRFKEVCDPEDGLRFICCFKSRNMDVEREMICRVASGMDIQPGTCLVGLLSVCNYYTLKSYLLSFSSVNFPSFFSPVFPSSTFFSLPFFLIFSALSIISPASLSK